MSVSTHGGEKTELDPLEQELQVTGNYLTWMLHLPIFPSLYQVWSTASKLLRDSDCGSSGPCDFLSQVYQR